MEKLPVNSRVLAEMAEEPGQGLEMNGRTARMGGIIAEKRMKATRAGGMMCFLQLEDLYGATEVLVFPRVYQRLGQELEADRAVLLEGKLSVREDEAPKLLLEAAVPLEAGPGALSPLPQASGPALGGADAYPPAGMAGPQAGFSAFPPGEAPPPARFDETMLPEPMRERPFHPPAEKDPRTLYLRLSGPEDRERAARILMTAPGPIRVVFLFPGGGQREAPHNLFVEEDFPRDALERAFGPGAAALR